MKPLLFVVIFTALIAAVLGIGENLGKSYSGTQCGSSESARDIINQDTEAPYQVKGPFESVILTKDGVLHRESDCSDPGQPATAGQCATLAGPPHPPTRRLYNPFKPPPNRIPARRPKRPPVSERDEESTSEGKVPLKGPPVKRPPKKPPVSEREEGHLSVDWPHGEQPLRFKRQEKPPVVKPPVVNPPVEKPPVKNPPKAKRDEDHLHKPEKPPVQKPPVENPPIKFPPEPQQPEKKPPHSINDRDVESTLVGPPNPPDKKPPGDQPSDAIQCISFAKI